MVTGGCEWAMGGKARPDDDDDEWEFGMAYKGITGGCGNMAGFPITCVRWTGGYCSKGDGTLLGMGTGIGPPQIFCLDWSRNVPEFIKETGGI